MTELERLDTTDIAEIKRIRQDTGCGLTAAKRRFISGKMRTRLAFARSRESVMPLLDVIEILIDDYERRCF